MLKWPGKIKFIVSIPKNSHGIKWNYGYGVYNVIVQKDAIIEEIVLSVTIFTIRNCIMKMPFLIGTIWGVEGV